MAFCFFGENQIMAFCFFGENQIQSDHGLLFFWRKPDHGLLFFWRKPDPESNFHLAAPRSMRSWALVFLEKTRSRVKLSSRGPPIHAIMGSCFFGENQIQSQTFISRPPDPCDHGLLFFWRKPDPVGSWPFVFFGENQIMAFCFFGENQIQSDHGL